MLRVGINGFGRIGRIILRALLEKEDQFEIVAVNDLSDAEVLAYMLKYDSIHGVLQHEVSHTEDSILVDGHSIRIHSSPDPAEIPWGDDGVDLVIESTGRFTSKEKASAHIRDGVTHVVVSAPSRDADFTVCLGVNESELDLDRHVVISNASCTTNCLAPLARIFHEAWTIEHGLMTTIHSYTNDQRILDLPHQKDFRRGRAAALSIIPTTTGAARAVGVVLPALEGKLDGISVRVPTPNVSLIDFTFVTSKETNPEEINELVRSKAAGELEGILSFSDEELVSIDFNHTTHSSIVDTLFTRSISPTMHKVLSWYDNEFGYSSRMVDLVALIGRKLG